MRTKNASEWRNDARFLVLINDVSETSTHIEQLNQVSLSIQKTNGQTRQQLIRDSMFACLELCLPIFCLLKFIQANVFIK